MTPDRTITALDLGASELDDAEKHFLNQIEAKGLFATHVLEEDGNPGFTYTTGLWAKFGHPEIVTFGLKSETAHAIMWDVYNAISEGSNYRVDSTHSEILDGLDVTFKSVDRSNYQEHFGWSIWFYRWQPFSCIQLVWPDRSGRFQWDAGFKEELRWLQPELWKETKFQTIPVEP